MLSERRSRNMAILKSFINTELGDLVWQFYEDTGISGVLNALDNNSPVAVNSVEEADYWLNEGVDSVGDYKKMYDEYRQKVKARFNA